MCVSCRQAQTDASPLNQRETAATILDFETPDGKSEKWCGVGAYEIHDQTAKGEADAIATRVVDRLAAGVDTLRKYYVEKYGEHAADEAIGKAADVGLFKLAGGTIMTDGASAAIKEQEEIKALVRDSVKEQLGSEWDTMSPDEQAAAVRVWCVSCEPRC